MIDSRSVRAVIRIEYMDGEVVIHKAWSRHESPTELVLDLSMPLGSDQVHIPMVNVRHWSVVGYDT